MPELSERSKQVRRDTYALSKANGGYHYGGSFSCVEILIALYDHVLTPDDIFILSKGHACWPLYVILRERGLNPKLEGHPVRDERNGIVCTTGSLGHGLPTAAGIAMAWKQMGKPGRVYVLMGDGEVQEGTTWEALLVASAKQLDNLTVIVDYNGLEGSGPTSEVYQAERLWPIFDAMGLSLYNVDGHNVDALRKVLPLHCEKTQVIMANTVKGYGVSFMEGRAEWHSRWPNKDEEAIILKELS